MGLNRFCGTDAFLACSAGPKFGASSTSGYTGIAYLRHTIGEESHYLKLIFKRIVAGFFMEPNHVVKDVFQIFRLRNASGGIREQRADPGDGVVSCYHRIIINPSSCITCELGTIYGQILIRSI
jgi:hypothetical protein